MQRHGTELARHGKLEFIMVGAREGLYLETIQQDLNLMELHNTRLVPETLDIYDWYRLADVFVCTSFEESFPRVLLESAAFKIPIVSTNVNGIPEMLVNNDKACLDRLHAGDTKMVSMAFARVSRFYDARISLERHVALAREAYFS
jgi:glycosyltransferase involved in cell wall biosynthesis